VLGRGAVLPEVEDEYVIGFGDFLRIQVYGEGDMAAAGPSLGALKQKSEDGPRPGRGGVKVRMDGRISLKHIGDVEAAGLTLTQLADYLKVLFATVYDDPIVTVVLEQSNSQRYTVMGKVLRPGVYFLDYPINIVQAVARCGGFTEWANSEITLIRKGPKKNEKIFKNNKLQFDYDDFLDGKNLERNILVKPGDIVIVH
jgi:polysaccharide export outer membrane protein